MRCLAFWQVLAHASRLDDPQLACERLPGDRGEQRSQQHVEISRCYCDEPRSTMIPA